MIKSRTLVKIAYAGLAVSALALPVLALAAQLPAVTQPVAGSGLDLTTIEDIIRNIAKFLIVMSLVIAVVFIIIGAIYWMSALGNEDKVKKGKAIIVKAIWGAAIVLAIGLILQTLAKLFTLQFFNY